MTPATDWESFALDVIRCVASTKDEFTADHVHAAIECAPRPRPTGDIRYIFEKAERLRIIRRTERFQRSTRQKQHGRHLRVWEPYSSGPRERAFEHPVDELAARMMVQLQRRDLETAYREVARNLYDTINPRH
jgi:hypothetical protein